LINTLDFKKIHKKKSVGVKSGERGGMEILPLRETIQKHSPKNSH